jgi:diacylglycerol O-acyltransferase
LFYAMESHDNPKHVAGLQIFEYPRGAGPDYLLKLVEDLRNVPAVAPFNCRPRFPRLGRPYWQTMPAMEMEYHLRHSALPKPGNQSQLMAVVQRLHAGVLDRERPGWFCQVIEGLEGNRWAMYTKIHHAYIDGMSGIRRMYGALSADPEDRDARPTWGYQPEQQHRGEHARPSLFSTATRQWRGLFEMNRHLLKIIMELMNLRERQGSVPFLAPRTHINDPVPSDLRSMGVLSMSLVDLRRAADSADCTINEVVLTLCDAALHDYLAAHGDDPDQALVAMCPMSLREEGDTSANTQVAVMLVELGTPGSALEDRLAQVAASSRESKREARGMSRDALIDYVLLLGGIFELMQRSGIDRLVPQSYNMLVSNVPGPEQGTMYLRGSRMLAAYPVSTLTPGGNLNITVLSHGDQLDVGLLAARGTLPDMERLVQHLDERYRDLRARYPARQPKRAQKAKTTRRKSASTGGKRPGPSAPRKASPRRRSRAEQSAA